MKTWIEHLLGANWRTSAAGLITTVAGFIAIYSALPESARADWKVWLPIILTAISKTVTDFQTKDKVVSGTPGTGFVVDPKANAPVNYIPVEAPKPDTP